MALLPVGPPDLDAIVGIPLVDTLGNATSSVLIGDRGTRPTSIVKVESAAP